MASTSCGARVAEVTAASVLGFVGLTAVAAFGAGPVFAAPGAPTGALAKASIELHSAALQDTTNTKLGAVTLADEDLAGPATVDFAVSEGGNQVGTLAVDAGGFSKPQFLPAGSYSVAVDAPGSSSSLATGTLVVTAGYTSSEVFYNSAASKAAPPAGALASFDDNGLHSVPLGGPGSPPEFAFSLRNLSPTAGAVDIYINGTEVDGNSAPGSSLYYPAGYPGTQKVVVVPAGTSPSSGTPLYSGAFTAGANEFVPLYIVDDPSQSSGVGVETTPFLQGYQFVASDGGVFNYASYPFLGSTGNIKLNQPMVGGAEATDDAGYWLVASDGGVFTFGNVPFLGSLGNLKLNSPIVGMASTVGPNGQPGYLLVGRDGGVFTFNAGYYGSLGSQTLASPVVGIAADPSTGSYTIAEANGQWYTFGPDHNNNPLTGQVAPSLNSPVVGITETPDGGGAWLVASDGGVFTIGNAPFEGSTGNIKLNQPVNSLVPSADGLGYNLIADDGGVFSYGDAPFYGSTGNIVLNKPVVGAINS